MNVPSVLAEICARKQEHVRARENAAPLSALRESLRDAPPPRGFIRALRDRAEAGQPALIAEIKKASPSGGVLRDPFDPAEIARLYEGAGANCLSVLTDTPYFQGQDYDLRAARAACALPALRKDFMIAPYQIYESRALGADCILIIMAALDDDTARRLYDTARELGMDTLIEVHDEAELERALALSPAPDNAMIGVNSRNLKTLTVDLATAHALAPLIAGNVIKVAESGIATHAELTALHKAGYEAFLVGESLLRQSDPATAVRMLLGLDLTQNRN